MFIELQALAPTGFKVKLVPIWIPGLVNDSQSPDELVAAHLSSALSRQRLLNSFLLDRQPSDNTQLMIVD